MARVEEAVRKKTAAASPLREYALTELIGEIERRRQAIIDYCCPYCGEDIRSHACKFAGKLGEYHPRADTLEKRLRRPRGGIRWKT